MRGRYRLTVRPRLLTSADTCGAGRQWSRLAGPMSESGCRCPIRWARPRRPVTARHQGMSVSTWRHLLVTVRSPSLPLRCNLRECRLAHVSNSAFPTGAHGADAWRLGAELGLTWPFSLVQASGCRVSSTPPLALKREAAGGFPRGGFSQALKSLSHDWLIGRLGRRDGLAGADQAALRAVSAR
jgi:hypothetical protein